MKTSQTMHRLRRLNILLFTLLLSTSLIGCLDETDERPKSTADANFIDVNIATDTEIPEDINDLEDTEVTNDTEDTKDTEDTTDTDVTTPPLAAIPISIASTAPATHHP